MKVRIEPRRLKNKQAWEFAVRFAFGGLITSLAQVVAHFFGPAVGGLFLAFPAILPAALTLVSRHDGREDASLDALGAVAGSFGLLAFALVTWVAVTRAPFVVALALAGLCWFALAVLLWRLFLAKAQGSP